MRLGSARARIAILAVVAALVAACAETATYTEAAPQEGRPGNPITSGTNVGY